jgi:hypothetical protein
VAIVPGAGVMKPFKRVVIAVVAVLACAGVYSALRNLPVASGCGFYGDCPETVDVEDGSSTPLAATPSDRAETSAL